MLGLSLTNMKTKKKAGGNLKTICSMSEQCKTSNYKNMLGLSLQKHENQKKNRRQPQNPHNHKQCQVFHEQTNKPKTKPLMQFDISTTF